ncbi:MAG: DUF2339 domain-containing protein, partial [Acidobacteriaceae bacterium]|nr:DUF2339 domain-containing protein [Acidobacteriaceae bacterium]
SEIPEPLAQAAMPFSHHIRSYFGDEEWEAIVGGSILNKVGALVLVIGIALFLGYSFTWMGPAGRASISAVLSIAMLVAGVAIERRERYKTFARGLIGAGWAGLYATAYAMYALPAARVIDNPFAGSVLLLIGAAGMIAHSLRYHVQAITSVAYFAAFAALAVTPSTPFSVVSLIPLAASLLYLAWRFEWYTMALFGLLATYGTLISRGESNAALYVSQSLFTVYWLLFEGFDLLRLRRRATSVALGWIFPLNAFAFLFLSESAWHARAPHELWRMAAFTALLFLASALARFVLTPPATAGMDPATRLAQGTFEAPLAVSTVLAALAILGRVHGFWAMFWLAVEAELLYLAGVKLQLTFLRALGAIALAFSLINVWGKSWNQRQGQRIIHLFGLQPYVWTPVVLFHAFLFYLNRLLWRAHPIFSFAGSTLIGIVLASEFPAPYDCLAIVAFTWALLEFGLRNQLLEFRIQAYVAAFEAVWLAIVADHNTNLTAVARLSATAIVIALLFAAQFRLPETGLAEERRGRDIFSALASFLLAALLYHEVSGSALTVSWGIEGVLLLVAGFLVQERILRLEGLVVLFICMMKLFLYDLRNLETMARILSFIALGVFMLGISWVYTRFRENIRRYL